MTLRRFRARSGVRLGGAAAALLGALCAMPPRADASPWRIAPRLGLTGEYQSNPGLRQVDRVSSTQATVGFSVPATWEAGRYSSTVEASGQLRTADGAGLADSSDYRLTVDAARGGERSTFGVSAGVVQTNLLGGGVTDVGLDRSGLERTYRASATAQFAVSELDSAAVSAEWQQRRFDAGGASGLVDTTTQSAAANYARLLTPQLQLLVTGSLTEFLAQPRIPASSSTAFQAGFGWQPGALWTVRAVAGRSRVRSDGGGAPVPGSVYDVSVSRRGERGSLSLSAQQQLQASPYGSVVRQRLLSLGYGLPVTERIAASVGVSRGESGEALFGLPIAKRRTDSAQVSVAYAVTEDWSLAMAARWTREVLPATVCERAAHSASSVVVGLSLSRQFGSIALIR